jgi:L-threonylcarbamoyladenylate synthase
MFPSGEALIMLYYLKSFLVHMLADFSPQMQQQINKGIAILRQGGIVAFPTDTLYGLGASANFPRAVERVYTVKQRPHNMALPLLLADISQVAEVALSMTPCAWKLMEHFWPGALTIVLFKSSSVLDIVTGGSNKVAVRIPAHAVSLAIVRGLGAPITGTSANLSGQPGTVTAAAVFTQLDDSVDLIIDGGRCPGTESTVVDVSGEVPVILRQGAIRREALQEICGNFL